MTIGPNLAGPGLSRRNWIVLLSVGLLSSIWCLTSARRLGPTFDEPFYIVQGLDYWRTGDRRDLLLSGVMPLSTHLQTLPLWIAELATGRAWEWERDVAAMLAITRAANLLFWWLLLFYAMRLGQAVGGSMVAMWSIVFLGFEPNFLAHASLATTDLSLAAALVMFVFYFREGRTRDWRQRVLVPGLVFALPVLAKASGIVFGPLAMMVVELHRLISSRDGPRSLPELWRRLRDLRVDGVVIFLIGFSIAMLLCWTGGYGSFQNTLAQMPTDNPIRPLLAWIASLPLFPNGLYAIWYQVTHNVAGHATYLIGYESGAGLWFYLPVMLGIKLPLATLLLLAATFVIPGGRWRWAFWLVGPLLAIAVVMRIDLGIRLVLPMVAFGVISMLARLWSAMPALSIGARRLTLAGLTVAALWTVVSSLRVWPDGIRYTNELWGDTDRGYLYVSDSNYDWGQGLPELAEWQQQRSAPVTVWYFGPDPRYPSLVRFDPVRQSTADRVPQRGYFAVGTTFLYGGYARMVTPFVTELRAQTPVARTRTFLIFDLSRRSVEDAKADRTTP